MISSEPDMFKVARFDANPGKAPNSSLNRHVDRRFPKYCLVILLFSGFCKCFLPRTLFGHHSAASRGVANASAAKVNPVITLQPTNCAIAFGKDRPTVAAIEQTHAIAMAPLRPTW